MPPTDVRAVLYLRVSTDRQTVENQRQRLQQVAAFKQWAIVGEYTDEGYSGSLGRDKRPGFRRMLADAADRKFDVVMVWSIDRLGRNTATVATTLHELRQYEVELYADREGMDSTTDFGRAMMQMAAVFGELELSHIRARIKAGIARVRETGKTKSGRPLGAPRRHPDELRLQVLDYAQTHSAAETARAFQMPLGTVQHIKRGTSY